MDDARRVCGREHVEQAVREERHVLERQPPAQPAEPRVRGLAFEQLHDEERSAVLGLVVVEHAHDAGMVHRVRDVPLTREPRPDVTEHGELRVQDFSATRLPLRWVAA